MWPRARAAASDGWLPVCAGAYPKVSAPGKGSRVPVSGLESASRSESGMENLWSWLGTEVRSPGGREVSRRLRLVSPSVLGMESTLRSPVGGWGVPVWRAV